MSTPVGPLGSGIGGGVELTVHGIALGLRERGHDVVIVAPSHSIGDVAPVVQVPGNMQMSSQSVGRDAFVVMPVDAVLPAMIDAAAAISGADVIVNCAYDWLPFWSARYLPVPVAHLVSMGSLNRAMDAAIGAEVRRRPGSVAVHSKAQAATFEFGDQLRVLGNGLDLRRYTPCYEPLDHLASVGRISPEKGVEDIVEVASRTGITVRIYGIVQDHGYWAHVVARHPDAPVHLEGFLPTDELQARLGRARAVLMTPRWVEAFGNVAIEALACGVPVIAYERGGPAEIITDGETGFIVKPDDVDGVINAIGRLDEIDRRACRKRAEQEYSVEAMAGRVEAWLLDVVAASKRDA